ncbi:uncharacterized protein B0T23DRAFT_44796 [Neurospora hispaniola]|uniref:Secreted protein n=1 Tax=Neurospora hispaniola TaxID=588809 RepID=A0AAJ0MM07_9PEZI|nr:hypothetical protein B0T23DRAFT_44796 [Neurospora hispaniola]
MQWCCPISHRSHLFFFFSLSLLLFRFSSFRNRLGSRGVRMPMDVHSRWSLVRTDWMIQGGTRHHFTGPKRSMFCRPSPLLVDSQVISVPVCVRWHGMSHIGRSVGMAGWLAGLAQSKPQGINPSIPHPISQMQYLAHPIIFYLSIYLSSSTSKQRQPTGGTIAWLHHLTLPTTRQHIVTLRCFNHNPPDGCPIAYTTTTDPNGYIANPDLLLRSRLRVAQAATDITDRNREKSILCRTVAAAALPMTQADGFTPSLRHLAAWRWRTLSPHFTRHHMAGTTPSHSTKKKGIEADHRG